MGTPPIPDAGRTIGGVNMGGGGWSNWGDWANVPIGECSENSNPIEHKNAVLMIEATLFERLSGRRYIEVYWNAGACIGISSDPNQILTSCNIEINITVSWPLIGIPPFDYPHISHTFDNQCSKSQTDAFDDISDTASYYDVSVTLDTTCDYIQVLEFPPILLPQRITDQVTCYCRIYP